MNTETLERLTDLGQLAAGLTHELRNPLNTIRFNLAILGHALAGAPAAGGTSSLIQDITAQVGRLEEIIREFLWLAQPKPPRIEPVQVGELLESVVRTADGPCRDQNIELSWDCSQDVSAAADPGQLRQVLLNSILNAQQAMPHGGRIRLRGYAGRDQAVVEVTDTGPGIPKGIRGKIFLPFFSTRTESTGLGLNISQRLLAQMNGSLEFRTKVGRGTTFIVRLPAADTGGS